MSLACGCALWHLVVMSLAITLHCLWVAVSATVSGCGDTACEGVREGCQGGLEGQQGDAEESHMYSDLLDKVIHSKVMADLKALPAELKESLLHVERRSLVVAGVVVAIGAALMLLGCLWIHWCHSEHGDYVPLPPAKEELNKSQHHEQPHKSDSRLENGVKKVTRRKVHVTDDGGH